MSDPEASLSGDSTLQTPLDALSFLLGEWEAISRPDEPAGGFTFSPALLSHAIIRTNYADYPTTAQRPAFRHEDLMVVYVDENQVLRAEYHDSEGHTIHYVGQVSGRGEVAFLSAPTATGPGFRLTYRLAAPDLLEGTFEIALPQQPGTFAPYLAWSARRKAPAAG